MAYNPLAAAAGLQMPGQADMYGGGNVQMAYNPLAAAAAAGGMVPAGMGYPMANGVPYGAPNFASSFEAMYQMATPSAPNGMTPIKPRT